MFKFGTIGAFKQVRNNPRNKAVVQLTNGLVVVPNDVTGNAALVPDVATAKIKDLWVVNNIIDKPEVWSLATDFVIKAGEFVRAFSLLDLRGLPVEIDASVITTDYTTIAVGDELVVEAATGKWVKADGTTINATQYAISLKVLEKSTFFDKGIYAVVEVK